MIRSLIFVTDLWFSLECIDVGCTLAIIKVTETLWASRRGLRSQPSTGESDHTGLMRVFRFWTLRMLRVPLHS
jgi:hypothetical protein